MKYLTDKSRGYDRLMVFEVDKALYNQMRQTAFYLTANENQYEFLNNNCLHQACKVLAPGDGYFNQWTSWVGYPNDAFEAISRYYGLSAYSLKGFKLSSMDSYSRVVF